jgi:GNAT superfamily N-acetyltransferase
MLGDIVRALNRGERGSLSLPGSSPGQEVVRGETLVRRMKDDDFVQAAEVLTSVFGRWPSIDISVPPADHLRWKLTGPGNDLQYQFVAERDGKIIGTWLLLSCKIKLEHDVWPARQPLDAAVLPEYRRQGVYSELVSDNTARRAAFPGTVHVGGTEEVVLALRAIRARRTRARSTRRRLEEPVELLIKALDTARVAGAAGGGWRAAIARNAALRASALVNRITSLFFRGPTRGSVDWEIEDATSADRRFDDLWQAVAPALQVCVVRDSEYLNWRYFDPRAGRYRVRAGVREGAVLGYCVIASVNGYAFIADLLTLPGRRDVAASLVNDAVRLSRAEGFPAIECWLARGHPNYGVFRRHGFVPRLRQRRFTFRLRLEKGADETFDPPPSSIHAMAGDSDLV